MKKKLFALLLALVMAVGAVPTGAFAANQNVDNTMEQGGQRSARPSNVDNDLDYGKQALMEFLDDTVAEFVRDQSYYCKEVWSEINSIYTAERDRILKIKTVSKLQAESERTLTACEMIQELAEMTLQNVQGKRDLKRLQQELKRTFKSIRKNYKEADYNAYYWNIYQDAEAEVSGKINKVVTKGTFAAYLDAWNALGMLTEQDNGEDEDLDWLMFLDEEDEEDEEESVIDFLGQWLYTKSELSQIRKDLVSAAKSYVKKDLPKKGYKGSAKKFDGIIKQFQADLKKIPDAETLAAAYENVLVTIDKKAKVNRKNGTPPTHSDIVRMQDKMTDLFFTKYQQKNYTEDGWEKLERIYNNAIDEVAELTDASRLKNSLITKMKKKLDKVPTKKEELSKARTKYTEKLKKLLKNRKYDQKKLKPIVKKGVAAIKRCTEPEDVPEVYAKHLAKTEKAILLFKIATKAKGKGTITKSAKVSYGDSFTVKIAPKPGHRIKSVFVDGRRTRLRDRYTFDNVKARHTVAAIFV